MLAMPASWREVVIMGRHVHFKNGLFNLWSSVIDAYELKEWVPEETIVEAFKEIAIEEAVRRAKEGCEAARQNKGCSIRFEDYRCKEI